MESDAESRALLLHALRLCSPDDDQLIFADLDVLRDKLRAHCCLLDCSEDLSLRVEEILRRDASRGVRVTDEHALAPFSRVGSTAVSIWRGDITRLAIDAIVNPASHPYLLGCYEPRHPCMDQAIHAAAGPRLRQACKALFPVRATMDGRRCTRTRNLPNSTNVGDVHMTPAFCLPCKHILHATGPFNVHAPAVSPSSSSSSSPGPTQLQLLQQTYVHILEEADRHSLKSVALACLSTGKFGFSTDLACLAALRTVKAYLESNPTGIRHVVFQVYMAIDEAMYGILGPWEFGISSSETGSGVTDSSVGSTTGDDESWEIWDESIRQQIDLVKNRRRRRGRLSSSSNTITTIPPLSVLQSLHYPYQMGSCEVEEEEEEEEEEGEQEQEEEREAQLELIASESIDKATGAVTDMLLLAALGDFVGLQRALEQENEEREMSLVQERDRDAELEREIEEEKERERERALIREQERHSEKEREKEQEKERERERNREREREQELEAHQLRHASPQDSLESQISKQALETARAQVQARRSQLTAALRAEARERLRMAEEDEESEVMRAEARLEAAQQALQVERRAREERALAARLAWEGQEAERRERKAAAEAQLAAELVRRAAEAAEALRLREQQAEEERERERVRAREVAEEAARKHKLALISSRRMDLEKEMLKVQLQSMAAHGEEERQELLRLQGTEVFKAIASDGASSGAAPCLAPDVTATQPTTPTAATAPFSPPRTAFPPTPPPPLFSHSSPPPFYTAPPNNKPPLLPQADKSDMFGILRQQQALLAQQQEELGLKRNKRREAMKKERGEGGREKDDEAEEAAEEEAEIRRLEERIQERARQAARSKMLEDKERKMELEMEKERQAAERAAAESAIAEARIRQLEEDKAREHATAELRIRQLMEERERERQAAERAAREAEAALARIRELELEKERDRVAAEKAAAEVLAQAKHMRELEEKQRERERFAAERNALVAAAETARIRELEERLLERERAGVAKAAVEAAARLAKIKQIEERQLERERQAAEQAAEQAALAAARIKQIEDKQRERVEEEEREKEKEMIRELARQRRQREEAAQLSAKEAAKEEERKRSSAADQRMFHKSFGSIAQATQAIKIQRLFRRRHRQGVDLSVSSRLAHQAEAAAHGAFSSQAPTDTPVARPAIHATSTTHARSPSSGLYAAMPPYLGSQSSPTTLRTPPSTGLIPSLPITQEALFFQPPSPRRASAPGSIANSRGVSSLNVTPPSTPLSIRAIDTGTQTPEWNLAPPTRLSLYEKSPDSAENADKSSDVSSDESFFVAGTVRAQETSFDETPALSRDSLDPPVSSTANSATISSSLDGTDSPRRPRPLVVLPSQRRRGRPSTPRPNRLLAQHSYYAYEDSSSSGGDDNIDVSDFLPEPRGMLSLPPFPHGYDFSASTWRDVVKEGGDEGEGGDGSKNKRVSFLLQGAVFFGGDESARAEQNDKETEEREERRGRQEEEEQEREERRRRRRRREKERSDDAWAQQHERLASPLSPSNLGTIVLETVAAIPWIGGLLGGGWDSADDGASEGREAARSSKTAADSEAERLQHQRAREEVRAREKLRERELALERQQRQEREGVGEREGDRGQQAPGRRLPMSSPILLAYTTSAGDQDDSSGKITEASFV